MTAFPEIAAAPTTTPPEPGFGASSFRCHATLPVFASRAYAVPPNEATNTQPPETTGVELNPVPSPVVLVENAHRGARRATELGVRPLASGCLRVLATSCPYIGQDPPAPTEVHGAEAEAEEVR